MMLRGNPILNQKVIFLTADKKKMLDANKILLEELNRDMLSKVDSYAIESDTNKKINDGVLKWLGFEDAIVSLDNKADNSCCPLSCCETKSEEKDCYWIYDCFDAYFTRDKKLILWEIEKDTSHSNNMLKGNLQRILKAMTRVMSFEEVINSKQMEQYVLTPNY